MAAEGRSKNKQNCANALERFTKVAKLYHNHSYDLGAYYFCQKMHGKAEQEMLEREWLLRRLLLRLQ